MRRTGGTMRLHDSLDYWAREQPDAEFAVQGARRLTYREAVGAANRLANAFVAAGLEPGARVALLAKNSIEHALLYYAASKAGAALVPLNFRLAPPEWAYILDDAQPRLLLAAAEFTPALDALRDRLESVERFVSLGAERPAGWEDLAALAAEQPETPPERWVSEDADLYQMYTSGTTGQPKGAVLAQRAVAENTLQIGLGIQTRPGERSLVVAPLFHAAAVPAAFAPIAQGGAIYVMESFNPPEVVRALSEERIGYAVLVPSMLQACLVHAPDVAERRYPTLRLIHYGSSPIAEQTLRRAMQVFGCEFVQSYGMTEATQLLTFLPPADHHRALAGQPGLLLSAGRAAVGTELRIVDADDTPLPPGAQGEIVARGPQLMRGYWNRPRETEETLRGGWLHTGDVGVLDADGYLYVQDRLKDMIVSGGENVYPSGVENVLYEHPAVADAAVIGVPDERWGETVKAVVVLRAGARATAEELIEFCRGKLAGFERPRSVDFVESLPRTASGKVLKRALRERYWAGQQRRVGGA